MGHYLVYVHGIGEQQRGWHVGFEKRIRNSFESAVMRRDNPQPPEEALISADADITQKDQEELRGSMNRRGRYRRFFTASLGDVVAYSRVPGPHNQYENIHKRFAKAIQEMSAAAHEAADQNAMLTVIAHSLGSVIASDGIYDLEKSGQFPENLSFQNFFTFGSPLSLFGLRYGIANFDKPVTPQIWLNFFYSDAVIGYPLRTVNDAHRKAVTEDVRLKDSGSFGFPGCLWKWPLVNTVGRLPTLNEVLGLLEHAWYWNDRRLIRRIGETLAGQWE